jgi:hypothetical protein
MGHLVEELKRCSISPNDEDIDVEPRNRVWLIMFVNFATPLLRWLATTDPGASTFVDLPEVCWAWHPNFL